MATLRRRPESFPAAPGHHRLTVPAALLGIATLALNLSASATDEPPLTPSTGNATPNLELAATASPPQTPSTIPTLDESLSFAVRPVLREMPAFMDVAIPSASTNAPSAGVSTPANRSSADPILASGVRIPSTPLPNATGPGTDELALEVAAPWLTTLPVSRQAAIDDLARSLPDSFAAMPNDGLLHRAAELLFPEPATVRWGKAEIGGGIVTAIRRENPFALLNPFSIFSISW